jgi:hypothetical protein
MAAHNELEETWGVAATHAEHRIGDYIRYSVDGRVRSGSILWIYAAEEEQDYPFRAVYYVVQPEDSAQCQEVILPSNVLMGSQMIDEKQSEADLTTSELEQALLEMCATLSIPVNLNREVDDAGQPFYAWYIGESTPQRPWGLYVGMDRHLLGALKEALEKLIAHVRDQPPPTAQDE